MAEDLNDGVLIAFEMLLEAIDSEIAEINKIGSQAFADGNHAQARNKLDMAGKVKAFRSKVVGMQQAWSDFRFPQNREPGAQIENTPEEQDYIATILNIVEKSNAPMTSPKPQRDKGKHTSQTAYYCPILESLVEFGGVAKRIDILARVEEKMKHVLTEADYNMLESTPGTTYWNNAADWARYTMVKKGLLAKNPSPGVWQISDTGKVYLESEAAKRPD